jgi:predicted alpha/beta-fold hydrolase
MAEEKWIIDTPDGKKIYGLINTSDKKKNNKAILHIHGLTGSQTDYNSTRMALTFPKKGYDVIRANLYYWDKGARSLFDCTIEQHAIDIDTIVKYFKKKYKKIFATGHSYGGTSLMVSKINQFNAVSLWDPTYLPSTTFDLKDFTKIGKYYIDQAGVPLVLSKEFLDESQKYDREKAIELSKKCKIPLQVIYAQWWLKEGESFHTHAKGPTNEKAIKKSIHFFYEEGTTEPLLRYTKKWFDQF